MEEVRRGRDLARVGAERTARLLEVLDAMDDGQFDAQSELPGWSRLTVMCHLRYGAGAFLRMTLATMAGETTSYYPRGRTAQRAETLEPRPGERPRDVLTEWRVLAEALDETWAALDDAAWAIEVLEPADRPDLGTVPLGRLAMARLLEVDVHGTDLGIGFTDWSDTLVEVALPVRLGWLPTRRTNHRDFDRSMRGSWKLAPSDGPAWIVSVAGDSVEVRPAASDDRPTATIAGSSRDLLALLLGRPQVHPLRISGDETFGAGFSRAFPGP